VALIRRASITGKGRDVFFAITFNLASGPIRSAMPAFPKVGATALRGPPIEWANNRDAELILVLKGHYYISNIQFNTETMYLMGVVKVH
jgi:hypothetical protein